MDCVGGKHRIIVGKQYLLTPNSVKNICNNDNNNDVMSQCSDDISHMTSISQQSNIDTDSLDVESTYHQDVESTYHQDVESTYHQDVESTYHQGVESTYHQGVEPISTHSLDVATFSMEDTGTLHCR